MLADKNATGHSIFGPSSAHRWMKCPRSLIAGHLAGDRPTIFAAEGSVAHWLAEDWLTNGNPYQHLGSIHTKDGFEIEITEEMISFVEEYVCWVSTAAGHHYVEVKVDLSEYTPVPSFGTSDHIHAEWQRLTVTDLKYGKVVVGAKENEQGMAYALGAFLELDWLYDFQEIVIRICQPRRDHYDTWICSRDELLAFAEKYRVASHRAWDAEAPFNPHPDACEYCPARFTCPALAETLVKAAKAKFYDFDEENGMELTFAGLPAVINQEIISEPMLPAYEIMPLHQLAAIYEWRHIFEKWFREAYDYLLSQLEMDRDVPGQKLSRGRAGNRTWTDAEAARKSMALNGIDEIDMYNHKFISPAQAVQLLRVSIGGTAKKNESRVDKFCFRPPGKLTMVPAADRRPAISSAVSAFDDLEAE